MLTLASFPFLNIHLHTGTLTALETEWLGFAGSNDYRHALDQALSLARQYQVTGWVADDRLLGAVRPRDLTWTANHVLARLADLGVQRFALLESQDVLNRRTIQGMYQQTIPILPFEFHYFDALPEARAWACGEGR